MGNGDRLRQGKIDAQARARKLTADEELTDELAKYYADPLGYVMFNFPWSTDRSIQMVDLAPAYRKRFNCQFGPDVWACEFLDDLGVEIKKRKFDGRHAVDPIRFSTSSGHGIGKSVMVAWLIKFILDTRPYSRGRVTAGTDTQLRSTTWAELGKWHNMSLTKHWFDYNTGRGSMNLRHREFGEGWSCDAITSREENSQNFAGKHAVNSTNFYIFDEASTIPNAVYEVRDPGGLTDGEPMTFDFGNPVKNSGMFYENCVGKYKHRYIVRSIDSRSVTITNKPMLEEFIADNGIDSDRVKARVLGQFPSMGSLQFIEGDDVKAAMARPTPPAMREDAFVLGVDVARHGDDEFVIYPRKGMDARSWEPIRWTGQDTTASTARIVEAVRMYREMGLEIAMIFVDETGLGGAIVDNLRQFGYPVHGVIFNAKPVLEPKTYRFRGDEIWGKMREAIKSKLVLPDHKTKTGADLYDQLTQREFGYTVLGGKVQLESKTDMKKRGVQSPDIPDALAVTFAMPVAPVSSVMGEAGRAQDDYDPLAGEFH